MLNECKQVAHLSQRYSSISQMFKSWIMRVLLWQLIDSQSDTYFLRSKAIIVSMNDISLTFCLPAEASVSKVAHCRLVAPWTGRRRAALTPATEKWLGQDHSSPASWLEQMEGEVVAVLATSRPARRPPLTRLCILHLWKQFCSVADNLVWKEDVGPLNCTVGREGSY